MAGNIEGGLKARDTNLIRYGADYYARMGRRGGSAVHVRPGGFAYMRIYDPERLRAISSRAGSKSRRRKAVR